MGGHKADRASSEENLEVTVLHHLWCKAVTSTFSLEEGVHAVLASCPFFCRGSSLKEKKWGVQSLHN